MTRKKVLSVFYDPWKFNFIQHQSTYGNFFKPLVSYKILGSLFHFYEVYNIVGKHLWTAKLVDGALI